MYYVFREGNYVIDGVGLRDEQKSKAVIVEELPVPNTPEGKMALLRADKKTDSVFYEYLDIPPVAVEVSQLETRVTQLEQELTKLKSDTEKLTDDVLVLKSQETEKN